MSFHNVTNKMPDIEYRIVITNTNYENVPESTEEQQEFIFVDFQCDNAENILINAEEKLENYFWIVFDMKSTEVSKFEFKNCNFG